MDNLNLKKLAQELNLSPSTVSPALRDSHEISEKTKERVRALAEKLNFHPTPYASSLRKSKTITVNTYEVCQELHICVPQQLKVISFSNLPAAALFDPPLSTVVQPVYRIGKEAAAILFKIVEKKMLLPNEKKMTIPSYIVERKSTSK